MSKMPGEKEYLVLFELCFCNLRFKFRFLEAPLGIESELITVSNFLHLVPKTSANKPAMVSFMTSRDYIKGKFEVVQCSTGKNLSIEKEQRENQFGTNWKLLDTLNIF